MKTYDPSQVMVIINGSRMTGFSEDSQIEVEYDEDSFSLTMGTDGEGTRVKSNNYSATFKISLMQSSSSNDILSGLWLADRASNGGIVTVSIKDNSGRSIFFASQAFIAKAPSVGLNKKVSAREWTLKTDNCVATIGGN